MLTAATSAFHNVASVNIGPPKPLGCRQKLRQDCCSAKHLGLTDSAEKPDSATRGTNGKEVESKAAVPWEALETIEKEKNL
jgi:hypothetical protein